MIGAITNGEKILEIQAPEIINHNFEMGDHIAIKGSIIKRNNKNSIYMSMDTVEDTRKIDENKKDIFFILKELKNVWFLKFTSHGAPGMKFNQKYFHLFFFFFKASVASITVISEYFEGSFT